jgi:hypothetical protein
MGAVLAAVLLATLAQVPQRDAVSANSPTGFISGRVTDADTAAPLRNARIGLVPEQGEEPDPVLTDAEGRFKISGLPPGRYTLVASKPGYVSLRYGARGALDRPSPIDVPQDTAPIDVRLPRGAALSGRLVDDLGEPIPDVRVTAGVVVRTSAGMRLTAVRSADTDDLGEYRIAGLPAGTYVVSARPGPSPPDGMMIVGMEMPAGAPTYARLYHPSTPSLSQARQIPLRAGDDLASVDITFRQVRRPRLTIAVRDRTGAATSAVVELVSDEPVTGSVQRANVDAGGTATMAIDPGDWLAIAHGEAGVATVPLTVGETDAQVSIVLARGTTLSGRIVYEGGNRPPVTPRFVEVSPLMPALIPPPPPSVGPDDSVTIAGVHDLRQLRVQGLPSGWRLKGVFLDGVDLMAVSPPQTAQISGVSVVLTTVHSEVSGTVVDARGAPVPGAEVLVYPRDPSLLVNPDRWARWVRADRRGGFVVRDLPAGAYLAVALADVDGTRWSTAEYLEAFRRRATSFSLTDNERRLIAVLFAGESQAR